MTTLTRDQLLALRGPGPMTEIFTLPNTGETFGIQGIVTSSRRTRIYEEIDDMVSITCVNVDNQRIEVCEDDIIASCWASACIADPHLSSYEWLVVAASNPDLVAAIGVRCLVCSRLIADTPGADGTSSALDVAAAASDPLASALSSSVSTNLAASQPSSNIDTFEPESAGTNPSIA